jgi:Secretion system C-terminal sorting domain
MKQLKHIFIFILVLSIYSVFGQAPNQTNFFTPEGKLDFVFDKDGNKYTLEDITIKLNNAAQTNGEGQSKSAVLCTSGYFNVYFEVGSGMDGNTTIEIARRNVICQLFSDISAFINSPLTTTNKKVNIWVRNINNIVPNASTSGFLGLATAFYNVPAPNSIAGFGGIADNEIWKTIISGNDSYTNVASPLISSANPNASSGVFYHGMMTYNFSNSGINWETNLGNSTVTPGLYDLYTVALHEVTHALGFASLINYTGQSKFGANLNYYSRYDLFLKNSSNTQNLIANSGACSLYNFSFSGNPSILTPGCNPNPPGPPINNGTPTDNTVCSTAINYSGSINRPVYTPTCFEPPSSLSHFEDMCPTTSLNNLYYNMSNATGPGINKRFLKPEERFVLCDLGYNVNTTYGSVGNNNFYNYGGSVCSGNQIAGINDGIALLGAYQFIGNAGSNITISGILNNDLNATSFECLQDIYDPNTTLSITNGTSTSNIQFSSNNAGVHLLRYIPVSTAGKRGNITYVYVYILSGNCTSSVCDLVNNGSFENRLNCGQIMSDGPPPSITCWIPLSGTPDLYVRNCVNISNSNITVPTTRTNPPSDTWNNGANGNDVFLGFWSTNTNFQEAIQNIMSSPILPNTQYTLKFWAKIQNNFVFAQNLPTIIEFGGSPALLAYTGNIYNATLPGITSLANVQVPSNNQWNLFSINFTYSGSIPLNILTITNATFLNTFNPSGHSTCVMIDDVSLQPNTQTINFNLPSTVCFGQVIPDLSTHLSPTVTGGTFNGLGVSLNSGIYSFNSATAGLGWHTITYTYTNNLGCTTIVPAQIQVVNSNITVSANASANPICNGSSTTLTFTGGVSYTINPGNITNTSGMLTVSPSSTNTYTIIGYNAAGCANTTTITINVDLPPDPNLSASSTSICAGQSVTLTPAGATNYVLNPGNLILAGPIALTPSITTTYTLTGTNSGVCSSATTSLTVTVQTCDPCTICSNTLGIGGVLNSNPSPGLYCVNNNFTVNGNVTISNSELKIAANTTITVANGANLTITGSHLYSCTDMWRGIVVLPGGRLNLLPLNNSSGAITTLIEDAIIAVRINANNSLTSNILKCDNVTFNKNNTGIRIDNYAQQITTYPFEIYGTLFTCREIPFTLNANNWPNTSAVKNSVNTTTSPLQTPYINNTIFSPNNSNAYLKAPYLNQKPQFGLYLFGLGATTNAASTPNYFQITVGTQNGVITNDFNLFDNLMSGIYGFNSNLNIVNSIFQNTIDNGSIGDGINLNSNTGNLNNRLVASGTIGNFGIHFYDCNRGIVTTNYFEHLISSCTFRSTQIYQSPVSAIFHQGSNGIFITSNRFRQNNILRNSFYNIENAIMFNGQTGSYNITGTTVANGQYSGSMIITTNTIEATIPGNPVTTEYVSNAIQVSNANASSNINVLPSSGIQVNANRIRSVFRGIKLNNWLLKNTIINSNDITLNQDLVGIQPLQYGISVNFNSGNSPTAPDLKFNKVRGFNSTVKNVYGILVDNAIHHKVECNKTNNTYHGIGFIKSCKPMSFQFNEMQQHTYGFSLDQNAVIGSQGSNAAPSDNTWPGTWPAGTSMTATLGASNPTLSPLYIRPNSTNITDPDGFGAFVNPSTIAYKIANGSLISTNAGGTFNNCLPLKSLTSETIQANNKAYLSQDDKLKRAHQELNGLNITISPNPSNGSIKINGKQINEPIDIIITDILGKAIYKNKLLFKNEDYQINLEVVAGTYIIKLTGEESKKLQITKIIIEK